MNTLNNFQVLGEKHGFRSEDRPKEAKNKGVGKNSIRVVGQDAASGVNTESEINLVVRGLDSGSYLENRNLLDNQAPRYFV